ncbi:protein translocase subunit SecF [Halarsenatibacter silvermanii]|uniref:Protein-export membrane protein SecF n=1 Tax=Halarsenatibacter silvermanii TaxID=321763 RepID=A0A1G9JRV7_9FIRM|nr:protein translocase subunit SecF [Halarsenatibacter silvermanii]SDL40161.1 protein translocase subunit secF [Halarsenatibacter silvermanii]
MYNFSENLDLMGKRKIWFVISAIIIAASLLFLLVNGLNLGLDFAGGTILEYSFEENVTNEEVREALAPLEMNIAEEAAMQDVTEEEFQGVMIRTGELSPEEITSVNEAIEQEFAGTEVLRTEMVGPTIGQELRTQALLALLVAAVGIVAYISFRFEFKFAVVSLATLTHDVILTVGVFALLQREINTAFIAALLTIVGYSLNDTIVIFDRIRENMKLYRRDSFIKQANRAVVETLPRSINTSMTTLVAILAIYLFGGAAIQTFMLALFIGMAAGTYSSIFVASPLLVSWDLKSSSKSASTGKA